MFNLFYFLALFLCSPFLLYRAYRTGRYLPRWKERFFGTRIQFTPSSANTSLVVSGITDNSNSCAGKRNRVLWFHGVSVGEIHLLTTLVTQFQQQSPNDRIVVSASTVTGYNEAQKRFRNATVIQAPFDWSWAIKKILDSMQPNLIILAESELWPNWLKIAEKQQIPVIVINGRLSPRSFKRYRLANRLLRLLILNRVQQWVMQSEAEADRLRQLGVSADKIVVSGSIKYDGAMVEPSKDELANLQELFGIQNHHLVWIAGSTHAPEEKIVVNIFRQLAVTYSNLYLILVPRSADRFQEVTELLAEARVPFQKRSELKTSAKVNEIQTDKPRILLVDTIGELGKIWHLGHIAFTGGSLDGQRGGQSMIEPAAAGLPLLFGPHIWNFRDAAQRLIECGGAKIIRTEEEFYNEMVFLIDHPEIRRNRGDNSRQLVVQQQGATQRTLNVLDLWLQRQQESRTPLQENTSTAPRKAG